MIRFALLLHVGHTSTSSGGRFASVGCPNVQTEILVLVLDSLNNVPLIDRPAMFARCSPIAGPSRITAHRTIYITCMRLAVPPNRPLPLPPKPGSNKPRPRPPVASPSTPPKPPATPAPPFSSPIPSKPSHSSKFPFYIIPSDIPGMIAEERVVFARPPDLFGGKPDNIRMIWAGSFFVAIVLVNMSMTILPEE